MYEDQSPAGARFRENLVYRVTSAGVGGKPRNWAGFEKQALGKLLSTGIIDAALADFEKVQAKLITHAIPDRPLPSVTGGVWVTPLVLANVPMCARLRTRTKLPPKNLELAVNVSAVVEASDITASLARIARAAWDYTLSGGAITITVNYVHHFTEPQTWKREDMHGVIHSIKVPLTNVAALASAVSSQQYRGTDMQAAKALSGYRDDGLPVTTLIKPGLLHVTGRIEDDTKARAALAIN